ncbi:FMN-linked oxidoreductase [Pilatotrama ljubarskyi]|nr:FMN-linked oxidoreductase [Pilatotrama ljubarskyi]
MAAGHSDIHAGSSACRLFQPARIGNLVLAHHIVLAPLTRCRANNKHVHGPLAATYYAQRASVPGTLLITEATPVAAQAGGVGFGLGPHIPGIWNEAQIAGWRTVVDAVHAKGSFIYMQLWALGRAADSDELRREDPSFPYIAPSAIPLKDRKDVPRPLTITEIKEYVALFARAASNAVYDAGFDGVEIHGANGYLVDQFLQDVSNVRTDEYGGTIENRCRFALEVVAAVSEAVGPHRTALRISPWSVYQDMRMKDPIPTFTHLVKRLRDEIPQLAYLHVIEPGVMAFLDMPSEEDDSNNFIRDIWLPRPLISAGRYNRESAIERAEQTGELIAFGRLFISNPDLPLRLRKNLPLAKWDHDLYYLPESSRGYTDYPYAGEMEASALNQQKAEYAYEQWYNPRIPRYKYT